MERYENIKYVSEAFSMQPECVHVTRDENPKPYQCVRIDFVINPNGEDRLEGRNKDGKLVFSWIAKACNIGYFQPDPELNF